MTTADVLTGTRRWAVEQSDVLTFLRGLPADSVDLVFCSPPYSNCRLYLEEGQDLGVARDTEEWVAWMVEVVEACLRVCKGLCAFVVDDQTSNYRYGCGPQLLMADLCRKGVCVRKPPIYRRVGIPGSGGPDWLRSDYESVVCVARGGPLPWSDNTACGHPPKWAPGGEMSHRLADGSKVNQWDMNGKVATDSDVEQPALFEGGESPEQESGRDQWGMQGGSGMRRANGKRRSHGKKRPNREADGRIRQQIYVPPVLANPGNVIDCKVGGGQMGSKLAHENEAPFPLELAAFFVRSFCPPGGVCCDPFAGSGTTGHACLDEGRRFIGCDLRRSQVLLTQRRLENVTPTLFGGTP